MSNLEQANVAEVQATPEASDGRHDHDVNGIVSWVSGRDIRINGIAGTVMASGEVHVQGGMVGRVASAKADVKESVVLLLNSPSPTFDRGSRALFTPPSAAALGAGFAVASFLLGKLFGRKRK